MYDYKNKLVKLYETMFLTICKDLCLSNFHQYSTTLFLVYGHTLKTDQSDFYILWPPVHVTYSDGVGQGQRDGQGETLRDSHHQHSHSDDEVEDKRLDVLSRFVRLPGLAINAKLDHTELDDQNQHHQYSHSRACRQNNKGWATLN